MSSNPYNPFLSLGLLGNLRNMQQGLLQPPRAPAPAAPPVPAPQPSRAPGGFVGAVGRIFGGQHDPRLSAEQNAEATKQAMLQAGLATLAQGPGGNFLQGLGQAGSFGQQAGAAAREQRYMATQEERLQQALNDPTVVGKLSPQQLAMIRMMPPMEAAKLLTQLAFADSQKSMVVPAGAAVIGPDGRPIFTNPAGEKDGLPTDLRGISQGLYGKPFGELNPVERARVYEEWRKQQSRPPVQVNLGSETEKGMNASMLKQYEALQDSALMASGRRDQLRAMRSMIEQGMTTGTLDAKLMDLRGAAAQLGLGNTENLSMQQLFNGLSNRMALEMKEGMTGPMSDKDIEFLKQQAPQLANTPEGNLLIIEVLDRFAERSEDLAVEADRYAAEKGSMIGWAAHRRDWLRANPLSFEDIRARAPRQRPRRPF